MEDYIKALPYGDRLGRLVMDKAALVISIISAIISLFVLLFYVFQEYREVITLYWWAEYDIIFLPSDAKAKENPYDFVEDFNKEFDRRYSIQICEFKHSWVGTLDKPYYATDAYRYFGENLNQNLWRDLFTNPAEHKYFYRAIVTHKGKKWLKEQVKNIKKLI